MFWRYGALIVVLTSPGCMGPDRFEERFTEAHCELLADCEVLDLQGYATHQECTEDARGLTDDCETFERQNASECIKAINRMDCESLLTKRLPRVCNSVCDGN